MFELLPKKLLSSPRCVYSQPKYVNFLCMFLKVNEGKEALPRIKS